LTHFTGINTSTWLGWPARFGVRFKFYLIFQWFFNFFNIGTLGMNLVDFNYPLYKKITNYRLQTSNNKTTQK